MEKLKKSIRVMGCGNLWMGDDGVGIRIVEKMIQMKDEGAVSCLSNVDIIDAGVSGLDMLPFLEGFDKIIIVDAIKSGENVGSILKVKGEDLLLGDDVGRMMSSHDVSVPTVLSIAREIQELPEIVVFGVEIGKHGDEIDLTTDMCPEVESAIDRVIPLVIAEIGKDLNL
ncbi:hydrogenase maturation protease [Methanolapillus millepedarum]|uniref:Hydrogenase maturation protease n=1 Tax=Methanolapillus millepedarum TaxID=3028296 RepID=A0AA96ZTS7_9EURY|nr:hypothetical protein MsAc7_03400 [Methanosarcinaceae archaeon Ac7]